MATRIGGKRRNSVVHVGFRMKVNADENMTIKTNNSENKSNTKQQTIQKPETHLYNVVLIGEGKRNQSESEFIYSINVHWLTFHRPPSLALNLFISTT